MSAAPGDQRIRDVAGSKRLVRAAVGEEAALAVRIDERDEPPGLMLAVADEVPVGAPPLSSRAVSLSTSGAPTRATKSTSTPKEASQAAWLAAEPPGLNTILARVSESLRQRPLRPDDDVRHHVADDEGSG